MHTAFYNLPRIVSRRIAGQSRHESNEKHEHFVPAPRFRVGSPPCENSVKTMRGGVASEKCGIRRRREGAGDTIHIDYDGEYGSERVLIISGRATVVPDDGSAGWRE